MPTIVNTYATPELSIGKSLEDLGNSMWGPHAAQADVFRQKSAEMRQQMADQQFLTDAIRANGGRLDTSNPENAARIFRSEHPERIFSANLGVIANRPGARPEDTTMPSLGASNPYGNTVGGVREGYQNQANIADQSTKRAMAVETYKHDNTPYQVVGPNGLPQVTSQSAAIQHGAQPVVGNSEATGVLKLNGFKSGYKNYNDMQQKAADVNLPVDKVQNYFDKDPNTAGLITGRTIDGKTDMTTGQPLSQQALVSSATNPGGTAFATPFQQGAKEQSDLRQKYLDNKEIVDLTNRAIGLVNNDKTIVGAPGQVQNHAQNIVNVARDVANAWGKGKDLDQTLRNVQIQAIQQMGSANAQKILPDLFGPYKTGVNDLSTIHAILTYKAASALFGQSGRDLSDRDVAAARNLVGDPTSWLQGSEGFLARMRQINQMAGENANNAASLLGSKNVMQPSQPAPAPAQQLVPGQGPSAAPPPTPQPPGLSSQVPLPGTPAPAPAQPAINPADATAQARAAIAAGADPTSVMDRLHKFFGGQ